MQPIGSIVVLGVLVAVGSTTLCAQVAANDRLGQDIDSSSMVSLPGSANPHAVPQLEVGRVDGASPITGITAYFQPSAEQKAELDNLVKAQQTPNAVDYHKWLTPAEYRSRFGLSDNDIAKIKSWLEQRGFSIDRTSDSHTSISFSGTVAQVESAFRTEIHHYEVAGRLHFANSTALQIPSTLAGIVQSVRNLDDFRPKAMVRFRSPAATRVRPSFTSNQSGNHYLDPDDVATIYDINAAYSSAYTGSGQSIAVVGQSEIEISDIEHFQSALGWTTFKDPTLVLVPDSGSGALSSGDEAESDIDLEYSGAIAKGAAIYLVYVGDNQNYSVFDSLEYAIDTRIAPIISISYGVCEPDLSASDYAAFETILEQGASQGQSIIVASGDTGSTACYADLSSNTTPDTAEEELAVSYPASSAYATAMGGSEFPSADVASSNTTYWQSTTGSDLISSALSYIPEQAWNDDSATVGQQDGAQYALSSGGGGTSTLTRRPAWQKGVTGIPSGSYRLLPDVSLDSSPDNAGYLYCSSDSTATDITGSCSNGFRDSNNQYLTVAGGTSFPAPIFAGMLAIINQKANSDGQGLVNSSLYTLAADSTTYASAFHDIVSGGNQCSAGSSYCSAAGESEYFATTGYDQATGLGSVDLYNLLSSWPPTSASALNASITTLSAANLNPSAGAEDLITITVAAESNFVTTTPSGTLTITVDGTTQTSSLALSAGAAHYNFSSATSGAHIIVATYSGNSVFAPSTGTVTVTVGSASGSGGSGGSASTTVTATPVAGYTGTIDYTLQTSSTYLQDYACYNISNATIAGTSPVSVTLTIYAGTANCSNAAEAKGAVRLFRRATRIEVSSKSSSTFPLKLAFGLWALFLPGSLAWRFGRLRPFLCLLMLAALGLGMSGCSGGSSSTASKSFRLLVSPSTVTVSAGSSGIPTGNYAMTIAGEDSSASDITASAAMTLTVD